jgi:hypothetical protein
MSVEIDQFSYVKKLAMLIKAQKAWDVIFMETGVDTAARSAIAALPASMANDSNALWIRLDLALNDRDWPALRNC